MPARHAAQRASTGSGRLCRCPGARPARRTRGDANVHGRAGTSDRCAAAISRAPVLFRRRAVTAAATGPPLSATRQAREAARSATGLGRGRRRASRCVPSRRIAERQFVGRPRVGVAGGDHQHVTGDHPSPAAGPRPFRRRRAHRRAWPGSTGSAGRPRWLPAAGPEGPGWSAVSRDGVAPGARLHLAGQAGARRSRGTGAGYGAGGRRGAAAGRSGAGTLGLLVNLRLLGNERHELIFIKRWCGSRRRVAHACERNRQKSNPS
ncbi:hypothetical protein SVIOM342S_06641 [Streptomyces violaceorubidus]